MKKSFKGKTTSKKPNNELRGRSVQLKKTLHVLFKMASKDTNLLGGEH